MLLSNQRGSALPYVIVLGTLIVANTIYFMGLTKNAAVQTKTSDSEISSIGERNRLGTILSDASVCADLLNFGTKSLATINTLPSAPLTKNAVSFLEVNRMYANNQLQFRKYNIHLDTTVLANVGVPEKENSLYATYGIFKNGVDTGREKSIIIPLYIQYTAGNVVSCYADVDPSMDSLASILQEACKGNDVLLSPYNCLHDMTPKVCLKGALNSVAHVGDKQEYTCALFNGDRVAAAPCSTSPRSFITELKDDNTFTCTAIPSACAAGNMTVITGGTALGCAGSCPALTLYERMNGTGSPTCYSRPSSCGAANYVQSISATGVPSCTPYPVLSKSCGATELATKVDASGTTTATILGCSTFSSVKACSPASAFSFMQNLNTPSGTCKVYTN